MNRKVGAERLIDEVAFLFHTGNLFAEKKDFSTMFQAVLERAMYASGAEGGSLYLYDKNSENLKIVVMENTVLKLHQVVETFDPIKINGFIQVPIYDANGEFDLKRAPVRAFVQKEIVYVPDLYTDKEKLDGLDFKFTYEFDKQNNYKTKNIVVFPLFGQNKTVLGAFQLINCDMDTINNVSRQFFDVLMWQISMLLNSALLVNELEHLLTALVEMVVKGIDEKSPHTAGHCHRVTELTMQIAEEMCKVKEGPYAHFDLSTDEKRELKMSAMLHDIGKIITPMHVMEKDTKLYSLYDRVDSVKESIDAWQLSQRVQQLETIIKENGLQDKLDALKTPDMSADINFIHQVNRGELYLDDDKMAQLIEISKRQIKLHDGSQRSVINEADLDNLKIMKGTLNAEEWKVMRDHVSISVRLLSSIPWPNNLQRVVDYAGAHHENLNGTGYPSNLKRNDLDLSQMILGFADRFEGMSAPDRPYRKVKMTLKRVMDIMGFMVQDGHIDEDMYHFFKEKNIHRAYAKKYLPSELIDC